MNTWETNVKLDITMEIRLRTISFQHNQCAIVNTQFSVLFLYILRCFRVKLFLFVLLLRNRLVLPDSPGKSAIMQQISTNSDLLRRISWHNWHFGAFMIQIKILPDDFIKNAYCNSSNKTLKYSWGCSIGVLLFFSWIVKILTV